MAADSKHNTIELTEENYISISGLSFSTPSSASLLPFIGTKNGSIEGMKYYKIPPLYYRISHLANSDEYKLERHEDKPKILKLKGLPAEKLKKLVEEFFDKELHDKTVKLYLDDKFNPILGGTSSDVNFVGVANLNDISILDLPLLRNILLGKMSINDYAIMTEDSKLFHLAEASARMNLLPYFYAHIEKLYPGITIDYTSDNAVKFNDQGIKLFLEFWVKNLGLGTAYFNLSIPEEDLLAFSSEVLEQTRLSKETASKISPISLLDFAEEKKILYVHENKGENESADEDYTEEYDETGRVVNFKGFPDEVFTSLNLVSDITMWVKVSWGCFINNYELFDTGCDVVFAPQQVVLLSDNKLAFKGSEIISMKYLGSNHKVMAQRNTLRILAASDVDNYFYTRISKYFGEHSKILLNVKEEEADES